LDQESEIDVVPLTARVAELRRLGWPLCVISLFFFAPWIGLYGQGADSQAKSTQSEAQPSAEIISSAGSYTLEWRQHYQRQNGLVPNGIADYSGTLWLITHAGPGKPEESLTRINPDGRLIDNYQPKLPLNPIERVASLAPAVSERSVGLLASIVSGGRDQTFEGAFFVPVGGDGLGSPVRIAGRGPQFPTMIGAGADFIAAGDQEPLTLVKLESSGKVLWRRSFSPKLVLPTVSIGSSGSVFVLSQEDEDNDIRLQMLDSSGLLLRSKRIAAKQGVIVADPGGGCSVLFSIGIGGKDNKVFLMTLNPELRQLSQVQTPLVAWTGRTYQLISTLHGHLIVGPGPEPSPQKVAPTKILAEFDRSGTLVWQRLIASLETPLLVPFHSGFYLVRELFEGKGMDIEKYAY
jgi:hypothetical protein